VQKVVCLQEHSQKMRYTLACLKWFVAWSKDICEVHNTPAGASSHYYSLVLAKYKPFFSLEQEAWENAHKRTFTITQCNILIILLDLIIYLLFMC
jgi:hypothetical protein